MAWIVESAENGSLVCAYLEGQLSEERTQEIRRDAMVNGHVVEQMPLMEACIRLLSAGVSTPPSLP